MSDQLIKLTARQERINLRSEKTSTAAMVSGTEITSPFRLLSHFESNSSLYATLRENCWTKTLSYKIIVVQWYRSICQTIDLTESEYVYPLSGDCNLPDDWQTLGVTDVWQRASQQAKQILSANFPEQTDSATDELIRRNLPIRLKLPTRIDNHEQ